MMKSKIPYIIQYLNKFLHEHYVQLFQCILAVVIFLLATYRLSEIGQPILFNDEIGYWSNSAFFMGDDWTSVTGRIGYYSYGYSLLLVPVRMLGILFGWGWDTLYHAAVMMNAGFLVMSYVLALKLSARYLPRMSCPVRTMACFTVFTYSSYLVYAHITWTECTLMFFFWVFLYVMMRVVDQPGVGNHIAFAVVSFYLYTVHQRALGIVVTAALIVIYVRLLHRNRLRDTVTFFGSMYAYGLIHAVVKRNLQNINYLGGEPAGVQELLGYAFTKNALILLAAGVVLFLLLWLVEKGRRRTVLGLLVLGAAICIGYVQVSGVNILAGMGGDAAANRLSTNDFSGQWGVIRNLFSVNGLIRLGISMTGKWFYMASVTGLVVCWGIYGLFENGFFILAGHVRQLTASIRGRRKPEAAGGISDGTNIAEKYGNETEMAEGAAAEEKNAEISSDEVSNDASQVDILDKHITAKIWKDRIWFLGVLFAWFSTFMISSVYKEGLYKNDDLVNGRYTEYVLGFVLLYGLYRLIYDKKWVRTTIVFMLLYIMAGRLCQYAWDELGRKEFELAHCVMFGRVVWNYEVPYGKIEQLERYILPLIAYFMILLKPVRTRFSKVAAVRTILALMIPAVAWSHLGRTIVDAYVVVRNEKQAEPFIQFSDWIRVLEKGEKVYYIADSANDRNPGALQFMLSDHPVTVTGIEEITFEEDAFYIMKDYLWAADGSRAAEACETMMRSRGYVLAINKNQDLAKRWEPFQQ